MQSWYLWSMISLLLIGLQRFIYKVAAEQELPASVLSFAFMASVALLSFPLAISQGRWWNNQNLILLAMINSFGFSLATLAHIRALALIPASRVYPLIRLNIILVVIFSWSCLKEDISPANVLGIVLALSGAHLLIRQDIKHSKTRVTDQPPEDPQRTKIPARAWALIFTAMLCGATATISCKYAARLVDNNLSFIALSYLLASCILFPLAARQYQAEHPPLTKTLLYGLGMGILNLGGFYAYLRALANGPLSLVATINGQHFVLAVLLACLVYREPLNRSSWLGLILISTSLVLLH